jgi:hypothetical protein
MEEFTKEFLDMMLRYSKLFDATICRHHVCCDILSILEKNEKISHDDCLILANAFCNATTLLEDNKTGDDHAIEHLSNMIKDF